MPRHGVPPIAARHLQEAIISLTLMHGSEVTWRGQRKMETMFQNSVNRLGRGSPVNTGCFPAGGGGISAGYRPTQEAGRLRYETGFGPTER